jgi:hypothetical protein
MIARPARLAACFAAIAAIAACTNPLAQQFEYEEQLYLKVDGRATVVVDSSLLALVALRGVMIDPAIGGTADRDAVRRLFEGPHCRVENVSRFWERSDRRFVQVRVSVDDVRQLSSCGLLSWSTYALSPFGEAGLRYQQTVGAPAQKPAAVPLKTNWDGSEIVAFRLHLPSRIRDHNVKRLDGENGTQERGNILTWPQRLADRRAGVPVGAGTPVAMRVDMDSTSILNTTLWIFGGAFAGAVVVLVLIIWLVIRRGRKVDPRRLS